MIDLSQIHSSPPKLSNVSRMSDGSEIFPFLWRYFLTHQHLRDWLMRAPPYTTASLSPAQIAQGTAFCCNFSVPSLWSDMAPSFDLGEMFVPDHAYSHFMCGSMVAATSFHKHLVCALGPAAARSAAALQAYSTKSRRIVVDMGSSSSINIIEFSWMADGALMVIVKVLVPPNPAEPLASAGCTGAFAVFTDVSAGGPLPVVPRSLVSFVESPRCPSCIQTGSLGCLCHTRPVLKAIGDGSASEEAPSANWPPNIANDIVGSCADTYHNVRLRLRRITHMAHVKVTAHLVSSKHTVDSKGRVMTTYRLGPSRFVVKSVLFRPANSFETDTLRQAADKLRLLRCGAIGLKGSYVGHTHSSETVLCSNEIGYVSTSGEQQDMLDEQSGKTSCETVAVRSGQRAICRKFESKSERNNSESKSDSKSESKSENTLASIDADEFGLGLGKAVVKKWVKESVRNSWTVAGTGRLACPKCDKTFSQQGSLNRHLKNIHDRLKIPCDYCPMTFGQMFDLKRHQRRKHADKRATAIRRERVETGLFRIPVGGVGI